MPRVASGDTLHTLNCLSSTGHFKRRGSKPVLNNESVRFSMGGWQGWLGRTKEQRESKIFPLFLGEGFQSQN